MDDDIFTVMADEHGWSKELLYQLVDNVKDYAIFVTEADGRIVSWNIGAEKIFGYTAKEAIGQNCRMLFTEEDRARNEAEREKEKASKEGRAEDERWHLRKDGSHFFASGVETALYDESGNLVGFAKIARDLTERVTFEDELRTERKNNESLHVEISSRKQSENLRVALLRRIVSAQEDERRRIAREIHDNIGQEITGLKFTLKFLKEKFSQDAELQNHIAKLKEITSRIDAEVDFLAWELRPSVIDDLGLAAAVKKFTAEWSSHFNIPAEFESVGLDGDRLLPEVEINLYRIAQEALNNAAKYANARRVSVLLEARDENLSLIVEDDGVGFEPTKKAVITGKDRGLGLIGMKERAELIGGTFQIESSSGSGTTVFVRVPARRVSKENE